MNKIILAYAPDNAPLALQIEQSLGRIGIPFEHVTTALAQRLPAAKAPVLLLVTDNLLTHFDSIVDLLPVLQSLTAQRTLTAVLANGVGSNGQVVETYLGGERIIDVSALNEGMYILHIVLDEGTVVSRRIVIL